MEKKQSEFNKVFSAWDILVIAFGAMIGWGWVVSSGGWIQKGGVLGAALGFVVGGVMIFFVGLTYAELTAAMPQCGGEHVWSHRAMGPTGSFVSALRALKRARSRPSSPICGRDSSRDICIRSQASTFTLRG